eukprot:372218_1
MDITNIYNQLSMIECTKKYINLLLHPKLYFERGILLEKVFIDNNKFCELYQQSPMNLIETCWTVHAAILHYRYPISLHTMRILFSQWIKTNNTLSTIKELTHKIQEAHNNCTMLEYCIFMYFLKLEIKCLNKNDVIYVNNDQIVHTLWNQWVHWTDIETEYFCPSCLQTKTRKWIVECHYNIFKILLEYDIDLKPIKMSWDIFYENIQKISSSQIEKVLLNYFEQKSIINDGLKDKWTYCISVLDSKSYDSNS